MKNFLRFLQLYGPYKWHVIGGILLSLITVFAGIGLLAVSGWFIAAMGISGAASLSMNYFTPAAMIRGLAILRTAGRYGERLANHDAALRVTSSFREWFYTRLEPLAPAGLSDLHSADIFSRLRGDIDVLERFYLNGIVPLCTAMIGLLIIGIVLCCYYLPLAILVLSLLILAGFIMPLAMRHRAKNDEILIGREKPRLNVDLAEMLHGMAEYLVYGRMENHLLQIKKHDNTISRARKAINRRECLTQSFILLASGIALNGTLFLVIPLVNSGVIKPAELAMIALFCLACFDIIAPLPVALQSFQAARLSAQRIFEITDRPVPHFSAQDSTRILSAPSAVTLDVENVSFSYAEAPVLQNTSFSLSAGEVMILTGRSGAGKSTILDLLLGFHHISQGKIFFDGVDADCYDDKSRLRFFSIAPQKPYFFADTLRGNLTLADPDIQLGDIEEACRVAGLWDVITNMPAGLDTYIGEHGIGLSGGQLRRVALARALLKSAPILLLDEPTEGLDAVLEDEVMKSVLACAKARGQSVILCLHEAQKIWIPARVRIISL